ncbi:MAG: SPOR domain-containing protein [Bacteroidales bacterium]|nr:SPOR domain-containing protein [Bacteroidales bacterium]
MIRTFSKILFVFFLLICPVYLSAQANVKLGKSFRENWFIGLSVGPTFFSGDLNVNRFLPQSGDWRVAGTFNFGRQLSHVFSLRGQVLFGGVAGRKATKQDGTPVNLKFTSTIVDGNFNTMINFSNLIGGFNPKRAFFVYGTVGIGAIYYKPIQTDLITGLTVPNGASSGQVTAMIPVGFGAYYSIANKVNLGLEYSFRTLTSDMLDGVAEGFKLDMYSLLSFNITLNINKPTKKKAEVADYKKDGPIIINLPKCDPVPKMAEADMGMEKLPPPPSVGLNLDKYYLFKVQIFAFAQRIYSPETIRKRYHIPLPVSREYSDGLYRFTVGSTESIDDAKEILHQIVNAGITDAFIVGYTRDGERTSLRDLN